MYMHLKIHGQDTYNLIQYTSSVEIRKVRDNLDQPKISLCTLKQEKRNSGESKGKLDKLLTFFENCLSRPTIYLLRCCIAVVAQL